MALTRANLTALMAHAVGVAASSGVDSRVSLNEALNRAGRYLVGSHPWGWRTVPSPLTLAAVANQPYIGLPAAFAQVLSCIIDNTTALGDFTRAVLVAVHELDLKRQAIFAVQAGTIYCAFEGSVPGGGAGHAAPAVLLWPVPTTAGSPTLTVHYRRGWLDLSDDTHIPDIPVAFEHALVLAARAWARNLTDDYAASQDPDLQAELRRLMAEDGLSAPTLGRLRGAAMRRPSFEEHPFAEASVD